MGQDYAKILFRNPQIVLRRITLAHNFSVFIVGAAMGAIGEANRIVTIAAFLYSTKPVL
jgi:hypothetical protein